MPKIEQTNRPIPVADESAYRAPRKEITQSTGMDIKKTFSGAPAAEPQKETRQQSSSEETVPRSEPSKEVTLSPQLAALARKEQKFRQQEQQFKAEREAFAAEKAEVAKLKELQSKLAAKDYSVLDDVIDYNEYSSHVLNKLNGTTPEAESIKKLEQKIQGFEEQQKDQVTKQYEATVNQYRKEIQQLVASDPNYDSVKSQKAEEHVLQHILDTFNEDGEILTVAQAAQEIEDHIVEEALSMVNLKRVQEKLNSQQEKVLPPPTTGVSKPRSGLRTLTNQVTQSTPSVSSGQFQHMSMKERIAQALARSSKGKE